MVSITGDLPSYVTRFQWDMAKYPIKQSLRNIADIISKQVRSKIELITTRVEHIMPRCFVVSQND